MDSEGYALLLPNGDCIAYWDKLGNVWTIGFGVTGADVKQGTRWTRAYAESRLEFEWKKHQAGVLRASPILSKYQNRLEAITDFAYNLGVGRYQASTLRRYVDQQRWAEAAAELLKWNRAGGKVQRGLTLRRSKEKALFLGNDAPTQLPGETRSDQKHQISSLSSSESTSVPRDSDQLPSLPIASHSQQTVSIEPNSIPKQFSEWVRSLFV